MQMLDASSIVHAWDNYPEVQFPKMWRWIATEIANANISMVDVALDEVGHVSPECEDWLKNNGIGVIATSDQILKEALRIKNLLGIIGDRYGGGVDENDLIVISATKISVSRLVSNEAQQPGLPKLMANYKIPAVCSMQSIRVECINFLELLKESKVVFG